MRLGLARNIGFKDKNGFRLPETVFLLGGVRQPEIFVKSKIKQNVIVVPIKSYTRRRVADSTSSTARRANAV